MHFPALILLTLVPLLTPTLARPSDSISNTSASTSDPSKDFTDTRNSTMPDYYEAVHQAEYRLADILDRKDFDSLGLGMTEDAIYDNSALPGGAVLQGLGEIRRALETAFAGAMVRRDVAHDKIEPLGMGKVHVVTYLIFSRWDLDPAAQYDVSKTYRIWEKCDDIWVLDQGLWKLKYSTVTNMGPRPEAIYWGDEKKN
ncbi:hypothetical protein FKW77_002985 [Venturia effusa]|uniref:SnoaL-like domain-containing protein n=1 Tax=Venturia effusa TaxID=50376 RepID=A0A517L512_9PEZI|nr:hypothetical protein FKW77_002985 [Venturia effusa]